MCVCVCVCVCVYVCVCAYVCLCVLCGYYMNGIVVEEGSGHAA